MNEHKSTGVGVQLLIALALALVAGILLAVWLIGSAALTTMGMILVVAIALAVVIGASALPIRAWKRQDFTGEHRITDGTRTVIKETRVLDGRAPAQTDVRLLQLPSQQQGYFPEAMRAAYLAGASTLRAGRVPAADYTEAEIEEQPFVDGTAEWQGDIRM